MGECSPYRCGRQRCTHRIDLLDYVRFQSGQERPLTGATINQRVAIADRALRIAFPDAPGQIAPGFQTTYWQRAPMGIGKPRPASSRLRVKTPKRTIVPLSVDEVARFWSSFRNSRDLAIVGLMLLAGTPLAGSPRSESRRSAVAGSADPRARQRQQDPLPCRSLRKQLNSSTTICGWSGRKLSTNALFVSLKGPARGARMTSGGIALVVSTTIAGPPALRLPTRIGSATPLLQTWCAPASACPPSCS